MMTKRVSFKNPLINGLRDFDHGDPFIYRFNGVYYLFTSAADVDRQGQVYKSYDLINYEYLGHFSDDPIFMGAFAPEIIYAYNKFYLCSSPKGKGHYIAVSDKVEGPYQRITNNINHMIDGSFVLDKDNKLYFLHASISGISMCDVTRDGIVTNERIIAPNMGAWTEGPSIVSKDGVYYLFYCGNHYLSKGYRVNYAISDNLNGPYKCGFNNPLLINTTDKYTRLGHSSEVLSPDLINYQIVYHSKTTLEAKRNILMDRLNLDKDFVSTCSTSYLHSDFNKPIFECFDYKTLKKNDDLYLSDTKTKGDFALVGYINKHSRLVFGYKNEASFYYVDVSDNKISIFKHRAKKDVELVSFKNAFDFSYIHEIRLVKESKYSLYIDNVFIDRFEFEPVNGLVGYKIEQGFEVGYLAFNNLSNTSDEVSLPSLVKLDNKDHQQIKYVLGQNANVFVSLSCFVKKDAIIRINDKTFSLKKSNDRFASYFLPLGEMSLPKKGVIDIELISGEITFSYLKVDLIRNDKILVENNDKSRDEYHFFAQASYPTLKTNFVINKNQAYESFALLINVDSYSDEYLQCRYPFNGLMVEFRGNYLSLYENAYERLPLFDRRINIKEDVNNEFIITYKDGYLKGYLNDELVMCVLMNSHHTFGTYGYMKSPNALIDIDVRRIDNYEEK